MSEAVRPVPIQVRTRGQRFDRGAIRELVRACLDREKAPPGAGVGVVLAGDRVIARLNRDYRGKDRTTDVLSFAYDAPPRRTGEAARRSRLARGARTAQAPDAAALGEETLLGEVFVSLPVCRAQAREQGVPLGVELVRLLVHGVLHILGHDHERPRDAARMRPRERALRAWAAREGLGGTLTGANRTGRSAS